MALEQTIDDLATGLPTPLLRSSRGSYKKYTPQLRADIGRYATRHGNAAKKFGIKESTVRGMKRQYMEVSQDGDEVTALH